MKTKLFQYSKGYDYKEYEAMCNLFKGVELPFLKEYDINRLLAEYIFCLSMSRIPIGVKSTVRRFLGGMFTYPFKVKNADKSETAFIFTGDGEGRPDYIDCLERLASQCENSSLYIINRKNPKFSFKHIFSFIFELIWAIKLNRIVKDFNISFDMAVSLYRTASETSYLKKLLLQNEPKRMVTFCDQWSVESAVTQIMKKRGVLTATLQHGNGTEIFYGCCSDYYLANSKSSKDNALIAGLNEKNVIITGPMKYAGDRFEYKTKTRITNIGIVFDGAQNFENNIEMLETIHQALDGSDVKCLIRFHPNNKREDYKPYIKETDIICDDLAEFEKSIDICIVYNSSMYTDMIYKKILVYRFKNGKVDLFPEINDRGFSTAPQLNDLLKQITENFELFKKQQDGLFDLFYGESCKPDSYRNFFDVIFR